MGNGDVLDIVVHKNIRLSDVIVSDILDSGYLPITFYILDHVRTKQISKPLEKFTDWERFQSLASNLVSPKAEINSGVEADKAACAFQPVHCQLQTHPLVREGALQERERE
jgi:hypothetical protein